MKKILKRLNGDTPNFFSKETIHVFLNIHSTPLKILEICDPGYYSPPNVRLATQF